MEDFRLWVLPNVSHSVVHYRTALVVISLWSKGLLGAVLHLLCYVSLTWMRYISPCSPLLWAQPEMSSGRQIPACDSPRHEIPALRDSACAYSYIPDLEGTTAVCSSHPASPQNRNYRWSLKYIVVAMEDNFLTITLSNTGLSGFPLFTASSWSLLPSWTSWCNLLQWILGREVVLHNI